MRSKKNLVKEWKSDVQAMREEKRLEKKAKKKNKKYNIPGHTADFMNGRNTYYKKNGVWKQQNK
ncbi:hypothetical protein [Bacillus mycoides]|uniref:hypothetical protein n=1 Tax=Bacillus mycoides TaxID=1405 RepID=UPI000BFC9605|nr:hypothetical protein [Bacillus mycoides]MCQ6530803.1 hypothetical protein [Bacillus mycoides]PGT74217.1 hypothetical protein COD14_15105 [Bacillus cereus]PGV88992.1 hypothetical protein COD86_28675 [Bacillus cereus]